MNNLDLFLQWYAKESKTYDLKLNNTQIKILKLVFDAPTGSKTFKRAIQLLQALEKFHELYPEPQVLTGEVQKERQKTWMIRGSGEVKL